MTLTADIKYKGNGLQGALKGIASLDQMEVYRTLIAISSVPLSELPAKRRNKWICALKTALAEVQIYGPNGNPDAPPSTARYTKVPWGLIEAEDQKAAQAHASPPDHPVPTGGWELSDKNAVIRAFQSLFALMLQLFRDLILSADDASKDIFGESDEVCLASLPSDTCFALTPPGPGQLYLTSPRRNVSPGDSSRPRPTAPAPATTPSPESRSDAIEMATRS